MQHLGPIDEIPERGLVFLFREGPFDEQGLLVRLPDGQVRAYRNQCRHLAVRLDLDEPGRLWDDSGRWLECRSHGARYRPEDGLCVDGPCRGSHLKPLPVEVRDGAVWLDTSKLGGFFAV